MGKLLMATLRGPAFTPQFCIGGAPSGPNSGLEISTQGGNAIQFVLPQMTTAQRNTMPTPDGAMVYNTSLIQCQRQRNGGAWNQF